MASKQNKKRAWQAPRVQTQRLYEQSALACGKNNARQPACRRRITNS